MSIFSMVAKKLRRRRRIKGTAARARAGRNYYTNAQRLIDSNYGLRFTNPPHARS